MNNFDKYYILFDNQRDRFTLTLYDELMSSFWRTKEIFILEELNHWREIDYNTRRLILSGLYVSHAFKQAIALEFIPSLIFSISDNDIAKKSMLTVIAARLAGQHSSVATSIIDELNESSLKDNILRTVSKNDSVVNILDYTEGTFNGMVGWNQVVKHGQSISGVKDPFVELNKHIWQSAALATVLLETSDSMYVPLLFKAMEEREMPEILKAVQAMIRDKAIISSFFSKLALSNFENLPKQEQKEQREWFCNAATHIFKVEWIKTYMDLDFNTEEERYKALAFMEYNVNKAMSKLNMNTIFERTEMPQLIEKFLNIDTNLDSLKETKRKEPWFSWRNR